MQRNNLETPAIHKRMSSLPQAFLRSQIGLSTPPDSPGVKGAPSELDEKPKTLAPVLPLKVGRHGRSKSAQPYKDDQASYVDMGSIALPARAIDPGVEEFTSPTLRSLRANAPAIPKRHSGRNLVGLWLLQGNGRASIVPTEASKQNKGDQNNTLSDEAPSLTNYSTSSDSTEHTVLPMQVDMSLLHSRHNQIRELYYTEKRFSRELQLTVSTLMKHGVEMGIPNDKMAVLLSNLSEIADISNGMLTLLEKFLPVCILTSRYATDERDIPSNIGRAMCIFLNSDMYRIFEQYIRNFNNQKKMHKRIFNKYLDPEINTGTKNDRMVTLRSLLQRPVQRLSQYPTILRHILESLPTGHVDLDEVTTAYKRSRNFCYSINARLAAT